ncbi:hypothetical protein N1H70_000037 [Pseudomonas aeruginosa]|nr:hypothetical protein [Pseudomonas aeruginosa]
MTDTNKLKELAERARDKGDWYKASSVDAFPEFHVDQEFMVATSPDVVLWLIAEVERLEAELSQCASALPGTYYMDPPDGGNVSIPEQIRRMAKDAARYRWLRDLPEDSPHEQIGNFPGWMWDEAIDNGMAEIQVTQPGATSSP